MTTWIFWFPKSGSINSWVVVCAIEIPALKTRGVSSFWEYPLAVSILISNLYNPPSLSFGPLTSISLLWSPNKEAKKSSPLSFSSIIIESISSETKLKTKNPLSALNSFSKRNCSPRSDLTRNVTSRNVILESKSIKEIEICWSSFVRSSFVEDVTSTLTSLPFNSTGGNISLPTPWPYASYEVITNPEENIKNKIYNKFFNLCPLVWIFL